MTNYSELVEYIIDHIGGIENVQTANHCATRLRLQLNDPSVFDDDQLKKNKLILGTVKRDHDVQLIIGPDVPKVYTMFMEKLEHKSENTSTDRKKRRIKDYGALVVDFISGTFVPVLPILVAAGLVSSVLTIGVTFFGLSAESGTYTILNAVNDAGFYFLPIYIGFSAARKLGINGMMGMFLGAILVHSLINGVEGLTFLGLSVPTMSYNTTTIPVIFGVLFMAVIDRIADKLIPQSIKYFVKPLLVILITVPVTLILLGPIGNEVGGYIANGLSFLYDKLGWFSVGLLGAATPLLVMTGTNQALFPLVFAMLGDYGYDSFVMPAMLAANVAVGASALAIAYSEKNTEKRALALSSGLTGVMGITEPAIFGVLINYRSAFIGAITGGAVGGILAGFVQLKQYAVVSPGLIAIPTFIPTDGSGFNSNFWFSIIVILLAICVSFTLTIFLEKKRIKENNINQAKAAIKINSPIKGTVVTLESVNDPMFAEKMMGDGIAIIPDDDVVSAPFDGYIIMTTPTKHAIGLRGENGVELLIHIGIDTVRLEGDGFTLHVEENQYVKAGEPLISFDRQRIKEAGYDVTIPVIVTNTPEHDSFAKTIQEQVKMGDYLFSIN
ncbi:beta-glucoside-specific PTS transporter subunit IIABC [Enterococcus gallinarum]|uniref:PTS system, beta-glucoside-specific IIABC component n=1 Tax=Enterococcus gallinarum TaxID=1353 RepID=A0A376H3M1_ENTGA|nr:beta-glucoside-specific PTS transporter subunit IIABC [Enterococcus gallinarum]OJG49437.1 PTS system beta-glucoside-specific EIIBCA component [Enterococcus gallinarum]STD84886.1 PTS system, beta-glucoside-specific IIABC component [Enterococcus gallinarum]STD87009.1 PTS system, beta-glucoside-specific IIABC component [Enterococcus gallinarum]